MPLPLSTELVSHPHALNSDLCVSTAHAQRHHYCPTTVETMMNSLPVKELGFSWEMSEREETAAE